MRHFFHTVALLSCFISTSAFAEIVSLDKVIEGALQKSTGISQVRKNYENKLADGTEVSIIDNPELQTDLERSKGQRGTGVTMELTQPFKFSQLTGARWRYADLLRDTASSEQQYEILKTINETTSLYMRLWLLQERKKLYETSATDAESMSKLVKASAGQGQTSAAALHLFAADAEKLKADAASIVGELRQTRTELAKMTGRSFAKAELKKPAFSKIPATSDSLVAFAKDRANLRNIVKAQIKAAEERVSVARQDATLPEFNPRLLYSRSNNGDQKAYGVGVQLRIPLWNQNDAERRRANADLNFAKSQEDIFAAVPPEEMIGELQQSAIAQADRADSYSDKVLPGYRKSYELTRAMFRQGQIDALEVWQVREKLYQTGKPLMRAARSNSNSAVSWRK
jgi:outer membrane protein TolC